MLRTLSTYLFVKRRLTPALLTEIARHGIAAVEIFCARAHFNYQSPDVVREIAGALRDHNLTLHALHAPA
jgi:sugar phosphate isomerase/epimerase